MLLVLHWYCSLYVLVLWVLLVPWYQPLYVSLCLYVTGTALYMYWYCGYCWYTCTSPSVSLCAYMLLVLNWYCSLYILLLWVLLVHLYQPLCLCTNILLVLHWYCSLYILVLLVLLVHWFQLLYVSVQICYWHCTGTALICTGTVATVGALVSATLHLCTNILLVLHWYCSLYVLVRWVLLVPWYQALYVSLCLYVTGTALYLYWYCWYSCASHSMSLHQYVTGTALVLLFICTGTVSTVGTLVPATLNLCAYMSLVPHWY